MNRINEYDIEPGVYRHYKGGLYVVLDIITHMENPATGKMEQLADPLVLYRDLAPVVGHDVKGRPSNDIHKRYARALSEFTEKVNKPDGQTVKRFEKE